MSVWEIDETSFQVTWSMDEMIRFWVGYGILAPSAHNNQPWRVEVANGTLTLRPDMDYVTLGTARLTVISLGAFAENIRAAAGHFGYITQVEPLPRSSRLETLEVHMSFSSGNADEVGFDGITKRHTNRGLYEPTLAPDVLTTLANVVLEPDVHAHVVTDSQKKHDIALLAARGARVAISLPPFRRELARFTRYASEQSQTGLLVEAMVEHPPSGTSGQDFIMNHLDVTAEATFTLEKFETAPAIIVISTTGDDIRSWFAAGMSIQRLLNVSAHLSLSHCIAAAPSEVPLLTPILRSILGTTERPQLTFRIGTPKNRAFTHASPRRDVSSITK